MSAPRRDIYASITAQIAAAIAQGAGEFQMPWHGRVSLSRPWNVATGRRYRGINIVSLWLSADAQAFPHPIWGSYQQWLQQGAQVRRGERASLVVFYKDLSFEKRDDASGEDTIRSVRMARASPVFNAAQVDGFTPPDARPLADQIEPVDAADALLKHSGADISEGGNAAYFAPGPDRIMLPDRACIVGSPTRPPTEAWYGIALHELTHWSGGEKRLNRDLKGRFGDNAYAMEELVAELGAAYLCADLGVCSELRPDHAAYIQTWLEVLKSDDRAIFTAAARAQEASSFLLQFAPSALRLDDPDPPSRPDEPLDGPTLSTVREP